jgi:hypothetical protein
LLAWFTIEQVKDADIQEFVKTRRQYRISLAAAVGAILLGTLFYHSTEHWSYLDAMYFSVVTLSTVGYGDFTPTTPEAKVFTIIYIIIGIGILTTFIQAMVRNRAARRDRRHARHQDK